MVPADSRLLSHIIFFCFHLIHMFGPDLKRLGETFSRTYTKPIIHVGSGHVRVKCWRRVILIHPRIEI